MILQDQPSQSEHLSSAVSRGEQRDAQRAMDHWRRNTWASEGVPLLDTFDFSPMKGDWGYRFLIRGDGTSENAVFVTYGLKLAQLLRLPDKPVTNSPFIDDIPEIYRPVFLEGYSRALSEGAPVNLKGTFRLRVRTIQGDFYAHHAAATLVEAAGFWNIQLQDSRRSLRGQCAAAWKGGFCGITIERARCLRPE
jgi:hypothetical protein